MKKSDLLKNNSIVVFENDQDLRESMVKHVEALDRVKKLSMLPDDLHVTVDMAANYFEVKKEAIQKIVQRHRSELNSDGLKTIKGQAIQQFIRGYGHDVHNLKYAAQLIFFPRRAVLRIGMLLRDSEVAKALRDYLLNVEEVAREKAPEVIQEAIINMADLPRTPGDLLIFIGQQMKIQDQRVMKIEGKVEELSDDIKTVSCRIENLDSINLDGSKRQHLVKMVRKLAFVTGVSYVVAWAMFLDSFNTAYRTNLSLCITNYKKSLGITRNITTPEYLEIRNLLDDAIRIADKLLSNPPKKKAV